MPFRIILTRGMAIFLLAAGLVAPLVAQQESWEEMNSKVISLYCQGKFGEAVSLAQEALRVAEERFGPEHPNVARSLDSYAALLRKTNRLAEAEELERRAGGIRA